MTDWLSSYLYRKKCSVLATAAGAQTNYQLKLLVGESSGAAGEDADCENHCQDFPNDIRFTAADGQTKHDYWVESITGTTPNQLAIIWIEIASVPASGTIDFYMYYDKMADSGESDGNDTFILFDDFGGASVDQNYFLNDVAAYGASTGVFGPSATYYSNRTYIAVHGQNLDAYAIEYNHTTGIWSDKVFVGNNPLANDDLHGSPTILRDNSGYLHMFYGCHNTAIQYAKSTNVDDITAWTDKGNIESGTYPHPILADNGDIYVFYRNNNQARGVSFQKSTDGGATWSAESTIIDFGDWSASVWIYISKITHESGTPEKVHMAWIRYDYPNVPTHNNVYYAYFNISDGHMHDVNGIDLGTTVTGAEGASNCLAYDSGGVKCQSTDVHIDSSGVPYIIFNYNGTHKFIKWSGSAWTSPQIIVASSSWQTTHDFIVHSSTNIEAYIDTGNKIEKWIYNGTTWSLGSLIADGADYDNSVCLPAIVHNYTNNLKLTFSQCLAGYTNKAFAHGDSGFIGACLEETTIDSTKWNIGGSPAISSGKLLVNAADEYIKSINTFQNKALKARVKFPATAISYHYFGFQASSTAGSYNAEMFVSYLSPDLKASSGDSNGVESTSIYDASYFGSYHNYELLWKNSEAKFLIDNVLKDTDSAEVCDSAQPVGFYDYLGAGALYADWVFVRNYVSPEPTWGAWDAEEEWAPETALIESQYTAKLGTTSLWVPPLSDQNFTITYEENNVKRFSFLLQNCEVNRTAIINKLTEDFVIYRGATPIFAGSIDADEIEYVGIDKIRIPGYEKCIALGYEFYKHMLSNDAEAVGAVMLLDAPSTWANKTTEANNATVNDIEIEFGAADDGIYIGHDEAFYTVKVQYSTKGVQSGTPSLKIEYSKGSGSWGTLDCIDTSQYFTADIGEHYIMIPNKPSDWAKDTVNGVEKFWIRIVLVSGSYITNPKLDQIWISQTDVCRVQYDNQYLDDMLDDVLIDTDYSFRKALKNSTFEDGVTPWGGSMTQSSTQKHSGTYSAKLVAAGANVNMYSEFMPATGFKDIAFWTFLEVLTTPPFRYVHYYYDRNGTYISGAVFMTLTSAETGWTKHEYTHDPSTFPAGTKYVRIEFDFWNAAGDPAGTVYIDDVVIESTVPHVLIPGMRGEYYSKLQWVAGLSNAATWEDVNGDKQPYLWSIDSDRIVHIAESTGVSFSDITSKLSVLNNKLSYFNMANRIFGLGSGDGINQTRAAVEDIAAQASSGLREALVTDARILEYETLKEMAGKSLTVSKTPQKVLKLTMPTYDWFDGGYTISDTIKLHQPVWGIPDETTYRIIRADVGKDRVAIDVGDSRQHLDTLQADLKAQIDVADVYMHGATNIYQVGPIIDNMERTDSSVFPLTMKIRIADDAVKINKVLLNWSLSGYRTFSTVASSKDLGTKTSNDGGAETITSGIKNEPNFDSVDTELTLLTTVEVLDEDTKGGDDSYYSGFLVASINDGRYHRYSSLDCSDSPSCVQGYLPTDLSPMVDVPIKAHTHKKDRSPLSIIDDPYGDYHVHSVKVPNHAHSVSLPDHDHNVILGSHEHTLNYGIKQESLGAPTLELIVNGDTVANNYTGSQTDINIAGYMSTGWNTVELQPKTGTTARLRAQLDAFVKVFVESR